jgi:hypothetical protein
VGNAIGLFPFFHTYHDISTVTGKEVLLFTLAVSPDFRENEK